MLRHLFLASGRPITPTYPQNARLTSVASYYSRPLFSTCVPPAHASTAHTPKTLALHRTAHNRPSTHPARPTDCLPCHTSQQTTHLCDLLALNRLSAACACARPSQLTVACPPASRPTNRSLQAPNHKHLVLQAPTLYYFQLWRF